MKYRELKQKVENWIIKHPVLFIGISFIIIISLCFIFMPQSQFNCKCVEYLCQ